MTASAAVDFQRLVFEEFVESREEEKDNWNISSSPGCCIIEPSFSPSNNDENNSILSSLLCRPKEVRYMYELTLLLSLEYGSGYVIHIRDMISKYNGRPCNEPREPRKRTHNIEMKENNVRAGCDRIVAKLNAASYILQEANQNNSILDVPDRESRKSRRVKDAILTQARHFYPDMDCALHPLPNSTDDSERKGDDEEEEDKAPTFKLVSNLIDG